MTEQEHETLTENTQSALAIDHGQDVDTHAAMASWNELGSLAPAARRVARDQFHAMSAFAREAIRYARDCRLGDNPIERIAPGDFVEIVARMLPAGLQKEEREAILACFALRGKRKGKLLRQSPSPAHSLASIAWNSLQPDTTRKSLTVLLLAKHPLKDKLARVWLPFNLR